MFDQENEPEDIFADVDTGAPPGGPAPAAPPQIVATSFGPSRTPIVLGVIAVLALAGGAGWYFFMGPGAASIETVGDVMMEDDGVMMEDDDAKMEDDDAMMEDDDAMMEEDSETLLTPIIPIDAPDAVLNALDSDRDGLNDIRERELGTNPQSADTDSDGLSDLDEVEKYGTDPTNPDTDGDGYLDGEEVEGGYNPNGPGTL